MLLTTVLQVMPKDRGPRSAHDAERACPLPALSMPPLVRAHYTPVISAPASGHLSLLPGLEAPLHKGVNFLMEVAPPSERICNVQHVSMDPAPDSENSVEP